jgi:hypothetical protein
MTLHMSDRGTPAKEPFDEMAEGRSDLGTRGSSNTSTSTTPVPTMVHSVTSKDGYGSTEETVERQLIPDLGSTSIAEDVSETVERGNETNENIDTDDCIVLDNNNNNNNSSSGGYLKPSANKYLVNANFNHNIKVSQNADSQSGSRKETTDAEPSWLPSILQGEEWPQENDDDIESDNMIAAVSISHEPDLDNPLLASSKDTVLWNNNTNAREAAAWKKYKEDPDFIINNKNNLRDLPSDQSTVPNTFANKINNKNNKKIYRNLSDLPNESPLKLFHVYEDSPDGTPTNTNSTKIIDDKLPSVIKDSDDLYTKIVTGSTSSGSLIHNKRSQLQHDDANTDNLANNFQKADDAEEFINDDSTNNTNQTNTQDDYTSDAEEFNSFPSTTRKMVYAGDQLLQHIREGFQNGKIPVAVANLTVPNDQSDYTSADDGEDEKGIHSQYGDEERSDMHIGMESNQSVHESTAESILPMNDTQSLEKARQLLSSQAEQYNKELNVPPPQLQQRFKAVLLGSDSVGSSMREQLPKVKGLNFIPAEKYKNKVYDKKLKKFVSTSQIVDQSNDSSYTNDGFTETTRAHLHGEDDDTSNAFDNLSVASDVDMTSNSILRTKNSPERMRHEVSFMHDMEESGATEKGYGEDDQNHDGDQATAEMNESFSMTDKLLVEVINESYPVEDWDDIKELDISGFELEQLYHLDKMTPNIWYLNASNNAISQNFGMPSEVQFLDLSFNKFSPISAKFDGMMFQYLQHLNLSNNELTDLRCLKELKNLTNLDLNHNYITNIEFLDNFKMLHFLDLSNNRIGGTLNFRDLTMWFMEDLILDNNELEGLVNICELPRLVNISANNNNLSKFVYHDMISEDTEDAQVPIHISLRRICLNHNSFQDILDLSDYINLKEVHLDDTGCQSVEGVAMETLKITSRYNNLDVKFNEEILKFSLHASSLRQLYLTGGRLPKSLPLFKDKNRFSSVSVLDISAMNLESIPNNFSEFFPLLMDLNLNFNKLKNLKGLENLHHLKQLKALGNQIEEIEDVIEHTSNVRMCLKLIDLRGNPLTNKFYPFIFYDDEETSNPNIDINAMNDITSFKLQDKEDIEAFSIEYSRLYEPNAMEEWALKSRRHQRKLNRTLRQDKQQYFGDIVTWFEHVKVVDGAAVNSHDRLALRSVQ